MEDKELRAQVLAVVQRVREIQDTLRLSDRELVARYPQLGSAKSWRERMLTGTLEGLNLRRLAARLGELAQVLDGGTPVDQYLEDLGFAAAMSLKLARLEGQRTDRRILVCLAPTGVGKTVWARRAAHENRATRLYVRANPSWRENLVHICHGILDRMGETPVSAGKKAALDHLIAKLRVEPKTLLIDEAHEGGVALMRILKVLVDETESRAVYLAYGTEFDRVRSATVGALIEAQQFLGRCMKPVFDTYASGTREPDVITYLRRAGGLRGELAVVAREMLPLLRKNYNLRLLDDAIAEARQRAETAEQDLDAAAVLGVVREMCGCAV
jgi:hypothetical protein